MQTGYIIFCIKNTEFILRHDFTWTGSEEQVENRKIRDGWLSPEMVIHRCLLDAQKMVCTAIPPVYLDGRGVRQKCWFDIFLCQVSWNKIKFVLSTRSLWLPQKRKVVWFGMIIFFYSQVHGLKLTQNVNELQRKNRKILLGGKTKCRHNRVDTQKPVLRRVWPMAREKEVTPAVQQDFLLRILFVNFYKDDMLPFLIRLSHRIWFSIGRCVIVRYIPTKYLKVHMHKIFIVCF